MSDERDDALARRTEHPEIEGDLADLQRLRELYQTYAAPSPEESVWNRVQRRVEESVAQARLEPGRSARPWWALVGLSAAAILAFQLAHPLWRTNAPTTRETVEPFPVAEADEVHIVSMDARDAASLVVGVLPLADDMRFAQPDDIRVIHCERCPRSGRLAHLEPGDEVPMFVSAVVPSPGEE